MGLVVRSLLSVSDSSVNLHPRHAASGAQGHIGAWQDQGESRH